MAADAETLLARGRLADARRAFQQALDVAERDGDGDALAEAVLGLGGLWVNEQRGPDEYVAYRATVDRALGVTDDAVLAARLRLRRAVDARYGEDGPASDVRTALEDLRSLDEPDALAEGLSLALHTMLAPAEATERAELLEELLSLASRSEDTTLGALALLWTTVDAFLAGRQDAMRCLQRLRVRVDELGHGALGYVSRTIEVMTMLRAGRLREVEDTLDDVRALGLEVGERDADSWYGGQILALRWFQGRAGELRPAVAELADSPTLTRFNRGYLAAAAALAAEAGADDEARVALAGVAPFDGPPHGLAPSSVWLATMFEVVEAVHHLGDAEAAALAYDQLAPFADLPMMASFAVTCAGSTHRALGLCVWTTGDTELAVTHLRQAIADDLRFGNRPMLAIARADLAETLLRRGGPDDATAATMLLDQALATADEIGMSGWAARWRTVRPPSPRTDREGRFERRGALWEVRAGDEQAHVPHSVGMAMLALLLASPGQDVTAGELTGAPVDASEQPMMDERARREVRTRLLDLQSDIDEAEANADIERASGLRAELDRLIDELSRTTALGGRGRSFAGASERARTSVQKAIRRAIDRIGEQAPGLADGLRASVHTGARCRFEPGRGVPATWRTGPG